LSSFEPLCSCRALLTRQYILHPFDVSPAGRLRANAGDATNGKLSDKSVK
jgi:hypothetical protein